jgi:BioD-like phosphotransacetylase family protein
VGKTAICAGLGKHLLDTGKNVGYFKPIIVEDRNLTVADIDSDAVFFKCIFNLEESVEDICPAVSDHQNLTNNINKAYSKISSGKDVVIIEGRCEQRQVSYEVAKALDAKVIIVESYSKELLSVTGNYKDWGEKLLGMVINKVPRGKAELVSGQILAHFNKVGINVLGVLPEDRELFTLTIGELAEHIHGEILNCVEKSSELVENFMIGAMCVDPGPEYFSRKANKAVLVRSDRPDMQLAALETSVKCLILSGDTQPIPAILYGAENRGIPIILARDNTTTAMMGVEDALEKTKFNQEKKLPKIAEIMEQQFNFPAVYQGLGLTK